MTVSTETVRMAKSRPRKNQSERSDLPRHIINVYIDNNSQLIRPSLNNNNLLLTEREGRTGEYWPEVVAVRTERSEIRTKTTEGQYSPVRLELARVVSRLLYGTRTMLVLSLPAFENKKYTAYDRFHGNGPYGEIPTKKEPIRTLGFTLPCNNYRLTHSASELSGFTCTSSLTMNEKIQYRTRPPSAVLKISSSLLVNEYR